jgi:predicted small lipoprotein YifL
MDSMRVILGRARKTCLRGAAGTVLLALLAACGQKGPLYLPADPPAAKPQAAEQVPQRDSIAR